MMNREFKSVHDSHCCKKHSHCKYGDDDCPVVFGDEQGIRGECCEWEDNDPEAQLRKKLISALEESLSALKRARPQILDNRPLQKDFDSAIDSAEKALLESKF